MTQESLFGEIVKMIPVEPSKSDKEFRFHFYDRLNSYEKLIKKYKNALNLNDDDIYILEERIEKIKEIIRYQYNGIHSTAFNSLNNLLGINKEHDAAERLIIEKIQPRSKSFYRMRIMENRRNVSYKEMFHIPFDKRGIISTQRFSFPGYPCLYLGESIYACWEELGRPLMGESMVSRYESLEELRLVDLRTPTLKKWKDNFKTYLLFFPIIMACSFKVKSDNDTFKPEYIIPQLIMEIIIKYNKEILKAKKENFIHGVYYSSVNKNEDFKFSENKLYNIAIPVIIPLPSKKKEKFCDKLSDIFKLTTPTCAEFENGKSPLLPFSLEGSTLEIVDYKTTEMHKRYDFSTYGLLEKRLKDTVIFPLQSMKSKD